MSYITLNDLLLRQAQAGQAKQITDILKDLIDEDVASTFKKDMQDGVNYFDCEHTNILDQDFRTYYIRELKKTDLNAANNKLINAFHTLLVNQKNSYICGNPVVFNTKDENKNLIEDIRNLLGNDDWDDFLCNWELKSSNKAVEWCHPYIDESGDFKYTIIPAEQIIPIYDSKFESKLVQLIRYYEVDYISSSSKIDTRYKVEWWTEKNVTYYVQTEEGNFKLDQDVNKNPGTHFQEINTVTGSNKAGSWGQVPFVPLLNNNNWKGDLKLVKPLIDDYDMNTSSFSNNLEDIQEAIWKMAGYEGTDLAEARDNLKTFKIVKLSADDGSDLEPITIEIPKEARDSHLDRLEENIFMFGMGVNPKQIGDGNITNVVIKSRYTLLDLKANTKIRKFKKALQEFMYFVNVYIGEKKFNYQDITFTFNKNLVMNTQENILNAQMSKGIVSDETILENHVWVDDVEKEKTRLEEQANKNKLEFNLDDEE